MNKAAFFDLDGVIQKGYNNAGFVDYMSKRGLMKRALFIELLHIGNSYKNEEIPYSRAAHKVNKVVARAFKGLSKRLVRRENKKYVKTLQYFPSVLRLLKYLNSTRKFIITASISENVSDVAKGLCMDGFAASELETKNGVYTGRIKNDLTLPGRKKKALIAISRRSSIDLRHSIAFGDTENDIEILKLVGNPVAMNPNKALKKISVENGWLILTEKDDIVKGVKNLLGK